jgi:TolB-like protein/tetratricopeptide (TPR) repeat protein
MFTDLVGYSSITSLDEGRALKLLEDHRSLLQPIFGKYQGTVVKTMGDGFLVEFASAVEAVNCAVQAQNEIRQVNERRRQNERVLARIGIHVGDVVHSGGDILGDAVNVAARLQPLAEAGGICVTRQVVDQVQGRVHYKMARLGVRELKNIRYTVELFTVEVPKRLTESEEPALDPRRIAILPFANLSSDPNDKYFADGMTEELISTVSRIGELSVISRTSVMRYRDTMMPIGDIGRELSAGTLLEGSVRKAGNKVRITTQLIDAKNDKHLWTQSYDRDMTDIFAIQGDIAEQVAGALKVKLLSKEKEALEQKPTGSPESYSLYLKGRYFWNERTRDSVKKAIRYFEEAVRLDPNFALAYSGLADCYLILEDRGWASHAEAGPLTKGYAEKALELDSDLAEAHASLGLVLDEQWDLTGAEKELKRAIALKPNYATAYHWYSSLLASMGKQEEALEFEKRALELDPYSSTFSQGLAIHLLLMGRAREAIAQFEKTVKADPGFDSVHFFKAWAHERVGDFDQAIEDAKKSAETQGNASLGKMSLAAIYARAGRREQATKLLEEIQTNPSGDYVSPAWVALVKFSLGENDEAFGWLNKAYQEHDGFLHDFREFPWCAEYRADPRWLEIERKMGLSKR